MFKSRKTQVNSSNTWFCFSMFAPTSSPKGFRKAKHRDYRSSIFLSFVFSLISLSTHALDVVIVNVGESKGDKRILFKNELVKSALEITKDKYGPYEIVANPHRMNISRAFKELEEGKHLSLTFAHTRTEFEQRAWPIHVPIRRGIGSYRLLMVRKGNEKLFSNVETLEDLKNFTAGLSPNWSTYKIMQDNGFNIVNTTDYSSMFRMLEGNRFDFVPRAINEVYNELEGYKPQDVGLSVVPNIALYIPSASYIFVSPKQPRLYQRLNSGLHALSINGGLSDLIDKYYQGFVEEAAIQNRRIITLAHSELPVFLPHLPIGKQVNKPQ